MADDDDEDDDDDDDVGGGCGGCGGDGGYDADDDDVWIFQIHHKYITFAISNILICNSFVIILDPFAMYALNQTDVVLDVSGNANPSGTAHGVLTDVGPYYREQAVKFKGQSKSYVLIPHNGQLKMDASFSITVWIYRFWTQFDGNIVTFNSGDQQYSGLKSIGGLWNKLVGTLFFPSTNQRHELATVAGYYTQWLHIALIYDYYSGVASLYINGQVYDNKFVGSNSVETSGDVVVGEYFKGRIACLQFYQRPLLPGHVHDARVNATETIQVCRNPKQLSA